MRKLQKVPKIYGIELLAYTIIGFAMSTLVKLKDRRENN